MTKEMIIFMGIQGSGKTFCFNKMFAQSYVHVNLDELHTRSKEQLLIEHCFMENKSFVVDNTNPTRADRERYIIRGKANGYRVKGYFFESKIKDCIERNNLRTGKAKLPPKAIAATSNKLQLPDYTEGFDELYFVRYINDEPIIERYEC